MMRFHDLDAHFADLVRPWMGPAFFGVSRRTLRRWLREDSAPLCARKLALAARGGLGWVSPDWHGFRLGTRGPGHDEVLLWTPEDEPRTPGDVRAVPMLRATIRAYAADARKRAEQRPPVPDNVIPFPGRA